MIIRPLLNSPDKTLNDVTFARRFWRVKEMIVCEQTRLRVVVLVGCLIKVFQGQAVLRSACIKEAPASQRALIQACTEFNVVRTVLHRSEVMVLMRLALFFTYS